MTTTRTLRDRLTDAEAALATERARADQAEARVAAAEAALARIGKIQQRLAAGKAIGVIRATIAYDLAAVLDTTE